MVRFFISKGFFVMMILSIFVMVVLFGVLFYYCVSLFISSLILFVWIVVFGVVGLWLVWVLVFLVIIFVLFNFVLMCKLMIFVLVFCGFCKVMLLMLCIEKEVIDVGIIWWEGDLFQGKLDWKKLYNYL